MPWQGNNHHLWRSKRWVLVSALFKSVKIGGAPSERAALVIYSALLGSFEPPLLWAPACRLHHAVYFFGNEHLSLCLQTKRVTLYTQWFLSKGVVSRYLNCQSLPVPGICPWNMFLEYAVNVMCCWDLCTCEGSSHHWWLVTRQGLSLLALGSGSCRFRLHFWSGKSILWGCQNPKYLLSYL